MEYLEATELYKKSIEYFKQRILNNLKMKEKGERGFSAERIFAISRVIDSYNFYLILSSGYENRLWEDLLNEAEHMEKFIIEETGMYMRHCINNHEEMERLIDLVASSFSSIGSSDGVLNDSLLNKLPDLEMAKEILFNNKWILMVIFIKDSIDNLDIAIK